MLCNDASSGEKGGERGAEGEKKDEDQEARQAAAHQAHLGKQEKVNYLTLGMSSGKIAFKGFKRCNTG